MRKLDPFTKKVIQLGEDLKDIRNPKRFRELILMIHIYCNFFMNRVFMKSYFIDLENEPLTKQFQEQILDKLSFNYKIVLLAKIVEFFNLEKRGFKNKKIIFNNLYELNGNRNRIAHNLDVTSLKFCNKEKDIDDDCIVKIMDCYLPLIHAIYQIETLI